MKYCKDCWSFGSCKAHGRTVDFPVDDGVCRHFDPILPQTNADRIRAMSDEELAEDYCKFLNAMLSKVASKYKLDFEYDIEKGKSIMLKHLQQPAEGD